MDVHKIGAQFGDLVLTMIFIALEAYIGADVIDKLLGNNRNVQ